MDSQVLQGYVLAAGAGMTDSSTKASVNSTGGGFTLIESKTTGGAPFHVHTREDEFLYVLEGKIRVQIDNDTFEVGERAFVFLPRNIPHGWDVVGEEATVLMATVPAMLDVFLDEFHAASSRAMRDEIAAKYGVTFL